MSLKQKAKDRQDGKSAISGKPLPEDESLYDAHRLVAPADGGEYTSDNLEAIKATENRDLHGNKPWLDDPDMIALRAIMEDYRTCQKLRIKVNNHMKAVERDMDEMTPDIEAMFINVLAEILPLEKHLKRAGEKQLLKVNMPIIPVVMGIKGIGPILAAELVTLLDIYKAKYPSSFWKFVGWHVSQKDRYVKGVKGGGHKHLRSVMYLINTSMMRCGNEDYTVEYYRRRANTDNSEKTVLHRPRLSKEDKKNGKKSEYVETAWKDVDPLRRHLDALRVMGKHFLADLWWVWRTLEGLPTPPLFVEEHLGHTGIIRPAERGWGEEYK